MDEEKKSTFELYRNPWFCCDFATIWSQEVIFFILRSLNCETNSRCNFLYLFFHFGHMRQTSLDILCYLWNMKEIKTQFSLIFSLWNIKKMFKRWVSFNISFNYLSYVWNMKEISDAIFFDLLPLKLDMQFSLILSYRWNIKQIENVILLPFLGFIRYNCDPYLTAPVIVSRYMLTFDHWLV